MFRNEYVFQRALTQSEAELLTLLIGGGVGSHIHQNAAGKVIGCSANAADMQEVGEEIITEIYLSGVGDTCSCGGKEWKRTDRARQILIDHPEWMERLTH